MVKPGGRLLLQSHRHRSEHWVVVGGTVEVTKGDEVKRLGENEKPKSPPVRSIASPPGKASAFLIEGTTLDEVDIVRYDDIYGRSPTKT